MSEAMVITGLEKVSLDVRYAVHAGILAGLETIGALAVAQVTDNIRKPYDGMPPAVSTGNLANSPFAAITPGAMFSRLLVSAGAPADTYADPINYGARAHMPPVNALLPWVQRKFGVDDEKAALKIAWAIAMSQKKKGIAGRFMFDRAQATIDPKAPSIIERQIAIALRAAGLEGNHGVA
jgi:hypothetical protein